jgi:hypothetical protein
MKPITIKNEKCSIEYRPDKKEIFGRDLTDHYNDPAFYTESKRGIAKAWDQVVIHFHDNITMSQVCNILHEHKIKTHYWCMMD